jgi:hypothetical protein
VGVATVSMTFVLHLLTLLSIPRLILLILVMFKVVLWPMVGLFIVGVVFRFVNAAVSSLDPMTNYRLFPFQCAMIGALLCFIVSILFAIGVTVFDVRHETISTTTPCNQSETSTHIMTTVEPRFNGTETSTNRYSLLLTPNFSALNHTFNLQLRFRRYILFLSTSLLCDWPHSDVSLRSTLCFIPL